MTRIVELLRGDRPEWDTKAPAEYPPRPYEWYIARAKVRNDERWRKAQEDLDARLAAVDKTFSTRDC